MPTSPAAEGQQAADIRLMIVLDTNVISELMRARPHPAVMAWVAAVPASRSKDATR